MKVLCKKIISPATKKDLGDSSPWLTLNREYVVLAFECVEKEGIGIFIQTDNYNEPRFSPIDGFEILNQNIPSSWITVINESYGRKVMTMLPASWAYNDFFEDVGNEKPEAVKLFIKEAKIIYEEEGFSLDPEEWG